MTTSWREAMKSCVNGTSLKSTPMNSFMNPMKPMNFEFWIWSSYVKYAVYRCLTWFEKLVARGYEVEMRMWIDYVVLEGESSLKWVPQFLGETGETVGWGTTMDHSNPLTHPQTPAKITPESYTLLHVHSDLGILATLKLSLLLWPIILNPAWTTNGLPHHSWWTKTTSRPPTLLQVHLNLGT